MLKMLSKWVLACTVAASGFFGTVDAKTFKLPLVNEFAEESANFIELNGVLQAIIHRSIENESIASSVAAGRILVADLSSPFIIANSATGDFVVDLLETWFEFWLVYLSDITVPDAATADAGVLLAKASEIGDEIGKYLGEPRHTLFKQAFIAYTELLIDEANALQNGDEETANQDIAQASALAIKISRGIALASVSAIFNRN